jgi:hypothetical protein
MEFWTQESGWKSNNGKKPPLICRGKRTTPGAGIKLIRLHSFYCIGPHTFFISPPHPSHHFFSALSLASSQT